MADRIFLGFCSDDPDDFEFGIEPEAFFADYEEAIAWAKDQTESQGFARAWVREVTASKLIHDQLATADWDDPE